MWSFELIHESGRRNIMISSVFWQMEEYPSVELGLMESDLVFGQLGRDSIESIWFTEPVLLQLRKQIPNEMEGVCGNCLHKLNCLGSCVAHTFHGAEVLPSRSGFVKQAMDAGLFQLHVLLFWVSRN